MKKFILTLFLLFPLLGYAQQSLVGFSKEKPSAKDVILLAIVNSQESIYLFAWYLQSPDIINALLSAKERGVTVSVILDKNEQNRAGSYQMLKNNIACYINTSSITMNHKVMVIDSMHITTGSFNFSVLADEANAENALYLRNVSMLANEYKKQWDTLVKTSKPCTP
jgi:phosphatidylserine/phosphatidylglycerophosphate/cardiolipin synthase-like enzyme